MEVSLTNPSPILKYVLCYPVFDEKEYSKRLIEAYLLGIRSLILEGKTEIKGIHVIGKGTTSIVVKGKYFDGRIITVKIRRLDSNRDSVIKEAKILLIANRREIGPKLIAFSRNFVLWEFIEGIPLSEIIATIKDITLLKRILLNLLEQAYRLDLIGVSHKELSEPKNHVLVTKDSKVFILDFETASTSSKKTNLTQLMNLLFFKKGKISYFLRQILNVNNDTMYIM